MKRFKLLFFFFFSLCTLAATAQDIPRWKLADLDSAIRRTEGPTILNFWATFCKPCLEELPYLQELAKKYEKEGVKLVLVSLDLPETYAKKLPALVRKFRITAPVVFLDESNADEFCPRVDESWSGVIPASLFVNNGTGYRRFFEDQLSREEVEKQMLEMIKMR